MNYFQLGRTDLNVSAIGFGAIPIIRLEHTDAVRVLRYALERKINFFDTANAYRDSEEKIGSAFAGLRDQVILASKTQRWRPTRQTSPYCKTHQPLGQGYMGLKQGDLPPKHASPTRPVETAFSHAATSLFH